MSTRDAFRTVLGYIGIVGGIGSLLGPGAPSVKNFLHSQSSERFLEWGFLFGGLLCIAALILHYKTRDWPESVTWARRADFLEMSGDIIIGGCGLIFAIASLYYSRNLLYGGDSSWTKMLAASVGAAFESGATLAIFFRVMRLINYNEAPRNRSPAGQLVRDENSAIIEDQARDGDAS